MNTITFALLWSLAGSASAMCFGEASRDYGVPETLLRAIAKVESGNNPSAVGKNTNGSSDLGLMQINSSWLPTLSKWGITRNMLINDACMNIKVGAWVMANNIKRHGYNWTAIGAYNVGCAKLGKATCESRRNIYSDKIYKALAKAENRHAPSLAQAPMIIPEAGIRSVTFALPDSESGRDES